MHYRKDETGKFPERPHYDRSYLDSWAERVATSFLSERYGKIEYPISTEDLTVLIEEHVDDFDLYSDLQTEYNEDNIEGVTQFFPQRTPCVKISKDLSGSEVLQNRLRTTLAHELGHVIIHDLLWQNKFAELQLGLDSGEKRDQICKRENAVSSEDAPHYHWMEWQANYFSSGILMPASMVINIHKDYIKANKVYMQISSADEHGRNLISVVSDKFQISRDAARVRLLVLKCICNPEDISNQMNLF